MRGDVYLLVRGSSLMKISMLSALCVWGKSTRFAGSRASASTAISSRSRCFAFVSPSLKARGDRVSIWLRHVRRIHPFLSRSRRIMKPSRPFSQARFGVSSERADETSSFASGEVESATSVRSSRDEKAYEELLEVVTRAVDRLHLDWPQEQETSKCSKLDDRYLSGGQGEGPQRRSLPFFGDLHDEVTRSWNKPYSSRVFVPSTSIYSTIVDARHGAIWWCPRLKRRSRAISLLGVHHH